MPERILITGGAGYLGSILCEHLLQSGYVVTVLDAGHHAVSSLLHLCHYDAFDFVRGDARDEGILKPLLTKADAVIPLAAIVGAKACDMDQTAARTTNFGAIELLNRLRSRDQFVIYPNTNSGYGANTGETFCTEETALEPISLYGRTKCDAENLLLDSDNVVTLRLATVFGCSPRMRLDLLVNHFTYVAVTDGYIVIFEKDFKRNYIHVRDVADAFQHVLRNRDAMKGRPYNAGLDDANLSKAELAEAIKEQVPTFFVHYAEIGEDPDKRNYIVSNQRLRESGFEARRSLRYGIGELIKGYRMLVRSQYTNV